MISVDEGLARVLEAVRPLSAVVRPLEACVGSVLAEKITAEISLPPFDNSAMDGYALRTGDVAQASPETPVWLRVVGDVPAGSFFEKSISPGEAVQIMTGARVPSTTDAVVKLEEARLRENSVEIRGPVPVGKHIRRRGEDVSEGEVVLPRGTFLRLQHLALLGSLGKKIIPVYRTPSVSFLTTGSELVSVGEPLAPGKIYDTNGMVLRKMLEGFGLAPQDLGTVSDDPEQLRELIENSPKTDLLILSGGVSVGECDYVKEVLWGLGMETIFWRVQMKPGQPLLFGRWGEQWVFGLPGNPISCVVCFLIFVRCAIQKMIGILNPGPHVIRAILQETVLKHDRRRHYLTAVLKEENGNFLVTPTEKQGSAMVASLAASNAFIIVPEERETLEKGERVDVLHFCVGAVE